MTSSYHGLEFACRTLIVVDWLNNLVWGMMCVETRFNNILEKGNQLRAGLFNQENLGSLEKGVAGSPESAFEELLKNLMGKQLVGNVHKAVSSLEFAPKGLEVKAPEIKEEVIKMPVTKEVKVLDKEEQIKKSTSDENKFEEEDTDQAKTNENSTLDKLEANASETIKDTISNMGSKQEISIEEVLPLESAQNPLESAQNPLESAQNPLESAQNPMIEEALHETDMSEDDKMVVSEASGTFYQHVSKTQLKKEKSLEELPFEGATEEESLADGKDKTQKQEIKIPLETATSEKENYEVESFIKEKYLAKEWKLTSLKDMQEGENYSKPEVFANLNEEIKAKVVSEKQVVENKYQEANLSATLSNKATLFASAYRDVSSASNSKQFAKPINDQAISLGESISARLSERGQKTSVRALAYSNQDKIIEKVKELIQKGLIDTQKNSLVVKFDPPELGEMTLKVMHKGGQVYARVQAESSDVEKIIRDRVPEIVQALSSAGLNVKDLHISVGAELQETEVYQFGSFLSQQNTGNLNEQKENAESGKRHWHSSMLGNVETKAATSESLDNGWVA